MNDTNNDFNLQDLWQKTPPVDVDKLMQSVLDAQKSMRRYFYFELSGTVFVLIVLVWAYFERSFGDYVWPLVLAGVLSIAFQLWSWTWRRGLWSAIADSPRQLFQVRRKHLLLDIKIAQSCYWGLGVGLIVGAIAAFFDKTESKLDLSAFTRTSVTIMAVALVAGTLVWAINKDIKSRKKLKTLEKKMKEFENEENL